jgi:hypothetical protein
MKDKKRFGPYFRPSVYASFNSYELCPISKFLKVQISYINETFKVFIAKDVWPLKLMVRQPIELFTPSAALYFCPSQSLVLEGPFISPFECFKFLSQNDSNFRSVSCVRWTLLRELIGI